MAALFLQALDPLPSCLKKEVFEFLVTFSEEPCCSEGVCPASTTVIQLDTSPPFVLQTVYHGPCIQAQAFLQEAGCSVP